MRGADFFNIAFRDLTTCRSTDGPIPWTAAVAYADRKGLAPGLFDAFWAIMRRMDMAERTWRAERLREELGQ